MIRWLISMLMALVVLADSQYCDKSTKYSSFQGNLPKDTTIGWSQRIRFFILFHFLKNNYSKIRSIQCLRKGMETKLNGTTFNYVVNNDLSKIPWTSSDYTEQSQCSGCISECKKANADPATICRAAEDAEKLTQLAQKSTVSLARPIIIIVIIVIWPGGCVLIILWFRNSGN